MSDPALWALWRDHGPDRLIAEIEAARTERDEVKAALKDLLDAQYDADRSLDRARGRANAIL